MSVMKSKITGPFLEILLLEECYVITIFNWRKRNSQNGIGIANLSISGRYIPTVKISLLTRS